MKLYKILPFVAVTVALVACDGKNEPEYAPSEPVAEVQRVYFAQATTDYTFEDEQSSVVLPVYRPASAAADKLVVGLLVTDPSGLFHVPANAEFAPGAVRADIVITFNPESLEANKQYKVVVDIEEAYANQYAESSATAVICHSVWGEWMQFGVDQAEGRDGLGVYTYSLLFDVPEAVSPVRVMYRTNPLDEKNMQFEAQAENEGQWEPLLRFSSADGGQTLTVPEQPSMEGPDGMIYVEDMYSYTKDPSYKGKSIYDAAKGLFKFNIVYFDEAGVWNYGFETLQLNGY